MDDLPSEDVQAAIEVERRIKKRYLGESETNLRPAVHEALRRLYSLPRLPANPYFFVATALSAHSSHGSKRSVWTVGDDEVMDELEDVTLVEGGNGQTCKLSRFSDAWGLPHVLRACDREGLTDVKTLLRRFPQTLYPTAVRQTDPRNPQVNRQALLSLQEVRIAASTRAPHSDWPSRRRPRRRPHHRRRTSNLRRFHRRRHRGRRRRVRGPRHPRRPPPPG